ncbi:MAG TPA: Rrf2 family transcriptional regulator, partial [Stellaceae bacterium]|nr:Rrf2 family transcriptional regulator [Stellaceae bacterium]
MLSQKAKYALRAAMMLAERAGDSEPVRVPEIAQREHISLKFLEAILVELRDAGIVESRRGRNGGYKLRRSPDEISFGDIIRVIDGALAPIRCASRFQFQPCADCPDVASCVIRWAMIRARDAISDALDHCTLAEALSQQIKLPPGLVVDLP